MLHAAFLRSPIAHARITGLDVSAARALEGVHAVYTAADLEDVVKPIHFDAGIEGHKVPPYTALSGDKARFVGDPVAVVIADSRARAEDALAAIEVEWEELEAVMTVEQATAPNAPIIFEALGDNVIYHAQHVYGEVDAAFERADRTVSLTVTQARVTSSAMETRGIVADFDPVSGELTCYASSKAPHMLRGRIAEHLGHDHHQIRVVIKDVGGAFGGKGAVWREDLVIAAASKLLGRPVKWIEDRVENLTAFGGARDQGFDVDVAVRDDGTILAVRMRMWLNHGAYPGMWLTPMFAALVRATVLSQLRVDTFAFETMIGATNKNTYISYRGPGSAETLVRERMLDAVAAELGIDPVEIRRRNLLTVEEQPWKMPMGVTVHRAHARETLERAVELADYDALRAGQAQARADGRLIGIGIATSIQPCPGFPDWWQAIGYKTEAEPARIRLEPDGGLSLVTSEMPTGQGHETTLAQVAAAELGVPFERIRVVLGDTQTTPFYYFGTGASRSSNMGAQAVRSAVRVLKQRLVEVAASRLGATRDKLEFVDGTVRWVDAPERALSLEELAVSVYGGEGSAAELEAIDVLAYYEPEATEGGWAASTHLCVVEVDPRFGTVEIQRYLVTEDCGLVINPAVVEGQIRGGIAQGIGVTLLEHAAYDMDGQYLAGSYVTYVLPKAIDMPEIEIEHMDIPTDDDFSARGVGESGMIMAPAALTSAIEDALRPLGARVTEVPLTPTRLLELMGELPAEPVSLT
jgi:aerobic carbon-monoxide dehydrogenase large subunit